MVCNERISRGVEFQIAGAEQRNRREPRLVVLFSREEVVLVRGVKRTNRLVVVDK